MGKIPQGILGGVSGRVGNIIGSAWKGINVIRSAPVSVANPNTTAQQEQRSAFKEAVSDAQALLSGWIKPLWDRFVQKQSGYNAWVGANISEYDNTGLLNPSQLEMTRGSLVKPGTSSISASSNPDIITVDVDVTAGELTKGEVFAAPYNETQDEWGTPYNAGVLTGTQNISIPVDDLPKTSGDTLRIYVAMKNEAGTKVSDTAQDTVNWP